LHITYNILCPDFIDHIICSGSGKTTPNNDSENTTHNAAKKGQSAFSLSTEKMRCRMEVDGQTRNERPPPKLAPFFEAV
jgi:Fe2+ or Zn2+ uptake regulation protein